MKTGSFFPGADDASESSTRAIMIGVLKAKITIKSSFFAVIMC